MPGTKGESIYSKLYLQLIQESTPGVYDPAGKRTVMLQVRGDFVSEEEWANFRPEGYTVDAWNALSKEHRAFNGTFQPDFSHIELLAEMACGIGNLVTTAPTSDTVQNSYEVPAMGERTIYTYTLERGTSQSCERCTYGILVALSSTNDRDTAAPEGSLTILCRKPAADAVGVPMTGGVAQNAVLRFAATGVAAPGVFALKVGNNAPVNVSLASADTTGQTVTKLAAAGITATVAGTVGAATGETHRIYGPAVNGSATYYGGAITLNPSTATTTTQQAAIQALGGDFANRTVSGTITPPTPAQSSFVVANCPDASFNGTYTYDVSDDYGNQFYKKDATHTLWYSIAEGRYVFSLSYALPYVYLQSAPANTPTGAAWPNGITVTVGAVTPGTPGFVDITITVPSGAGNVADIEANPGVGYTGTTTPMGGASGVITATVTSPANTPITVTPVSGAGWTGTQQQVGGDGKFRIPKRLPMMPQMFTFRQADTRAGLDTAAPVAKVKRLGWNMESLASMEWFFDENNLTPQSHTDNADAKQSITALVAASSPALAQLQSDAKQQPSTPRWREIRALHPDAKHLFRFIMYGSTMAAAPIQAAGNIQSYEFNIGAVLTDTPANDNSCAIVVRRLA